MAIQSGRILVGALDRIVCNSANYWAAMLCDLAAALAFLALGLNRFSGSWVVAGGVVIAGFMSLGLLNSPCIGGSYTAHSPWRGVVTRNTTQSPERSSARRSSSS